MSGSCLTKHKEKFFELLSDVAINTDIKQAELDKVKKRSLSGLEAAKNEPDQMLNNVSAVVNYGKKHPYGEVSTEASVKAVTLEALRRYYSTYFKPNVAYMAIVGDVNPLEIKGLLIKYFGNWQRADVPVTTYINAEAPTSTRVAFVPREGAVQSVINVTYPIDLQPGTPDVIKLKVTNSILGGGSIGRLFLNLREKHGWTYGSYSSVAQDPIKGHFTAYAKCRNAVSDSSVAEILNEMHRLQTEKISKEELQNNLTYMSGSFAISLESPQTVAQYAINIERYHMPPDYYQNYLKNLNAVTAQDVMDAAQKYIHPDRANIVVVGSKNDVAKTLAKYATDNTVSYFDNYGDPTTAPEAKAVPANVTADGILKKYIDAIGGEKAIMNIKDIKTISKATFDAGTQKIDLTITEMKKAPNEMKLIVEGIGMVFNKTVFDGTKGYTENNGNRKDMDAAQVEESKIQADIYADLHPDKYGIKRTVTGMEQLNGADAYVIEATTGAGKKSTEYYDATSGFLLKKIQIQKTPQGDATVVSEYDNYKEVTGGGGYKIPYTVRKGTGGQMVAASVQSVDINKGVADTEFN